MRDSFQRSVYIGFNTNRCPEPTKIAVCEWKGDNSLAKDEEGRILITQQSFICPILMSTQSPSFYCDVVESLSNNIIILLWELVDVYRHKGVRDN